MNGEEFSARLKICRGEAHRLLYDEYYNYVGTIVVNRLGHMGSREDIEECISDAFAKVFVSLEDDPIEGELKTYIGTIAKRTSIDRFRNLSRRAGKNISLDEEEFFSLSSDDDLEADNERRELRRIVADCIKSLGEPDSTIVIQKFYYNKNSHQIAGLLSMKPSAVRMRVKRAAAKLKDALAERGIKEDSL